VVFNYSVSRAFFNVSVDPVSCDINTDAQAYLEYDLGNGNYQEIVIMPYDSMSEHYRLPYYFATTKYFYQDAARYDSAEMKTQLKNFLNYVVNNRFVEIRLKLVTQNNGIEAVYYGAVSNENKYGYGSQELGPLQVMQTSTYTAVRYTYAQFIKGFQIQFDKIYLDMIMDETTFTRTEVP